MTQQSHFITGLDIGGAHLKAARIDRATGQVIEVKQFVCPLWKGIELLEKSLTEVVNHFQNGQDTIAITMTGELVDIFADRQSGVSDIIDCVLKQWSIEQCHVFAGEKAWLTPAKAKIQWQQVASRNWQASAQYCAQHHANGLFIDLGSTTCDIIPLIDGNAAPKGYSDQKRQASRELLYTGSIRTPLIALTDNAPFNGELISLAAEVFATTGDIWSLLGLLDPSEIQDDSADGQPWQTEDCMRRIARLLGTDSCEASHQSWIILAKWFAQQQITQINNAILQILSAQPQLHDKPVIAAGVGAAIIKQCAQQLNHDCIDFSDLVTPSTKSATDHAPAVAIALLANLELT